MNLRQLEVFRAVMLCGSVSGAARLLKVSQPSLSRLLAHAEQQIGFALFHRVRGRLQPTREAVMLQAEAQKVATSMDAFTQLAGNLRQRAASRLRIAGLPSLMLSVVPKAVVALERRPRRLALDLRTHHTDEIVRGLRARELDFGLVFDVAPPQHDGLDAIAIGTGQMVYVGRDARSGQPRALQELAGQDVILPRRDDPVSAALYDAVAAQGVALEARLTSNVFYVARALVQAGLGGAVIDSFSAAGLSLPWTPLQPEIAFKVYLLRGEDWAQRGVERDLVQSLRASCA